MRLMPVLPLVLAAVLAGCAGAPASTPAASTDAARSAAQVASAVAKTKPQLEAAMTRFEAGDCWPVMELGTGDGMAALNCVNTMADVGAQSRIMRKDLDAARPWPEEVRVLAEETARELDRISEASNYGDGKKISVFTSAMQSMRSQLQGWKPFGA